MVTSKGRKELEGATLVEKARFFALWNLRLGSWPTDLVIQAQVAERRNGGQPDTAVSPKDLGKFFTKLVHTPPQERYDLLAAPIRRKKGSDEAHQQVWFDVIPGLTEPPIIRSIARAARALLPPNKHIWERAADMGAATGKLGAALHGKDQQERVAKDVTLIDNNSSLLAVAASRYGKSMTYCRSDVTDIPLPDESFDLIASSGLVYNLGADLQDSYFSEVSRLLSPGGVYLDADYTDHGDSTYGYNFGRDQLNQFIKTTVAANEHWHGDPLHGVDKISFFGRIGLRLSNHQYVDELSGAQVSVRALEKAI